jgi:hypothetical protein
MLGRVRDAGPGIRDVAAALRDGVSSGGSLGSGCPAARRLMDAFAIDSGPADGTVVRMARWAGGADAARAVACRMRRPGGEALMQPYRNGVLLALAAGRASAELGAAVADAAVACAGAARGRGPRGLARRRALGVAMAAFSALDGRLDWLAARRGGAGPVRGRPVCWRGRRAGARSAARRRPARRATDDPRATTCSCSRAAPLGRSARSAARGTGRAPAAGRALRPRRLEPARAPRPHGADD